MTPTQKKTEIEKWITHFKEQFSLQEWDIKVQYVKVIEEAEPSPGAITAIADYRVARLQMVLTKLNTPKFIRRVVKHEMLHLFHADMSRLMERLLGMIPEKYHEVGTVYWNSFCDLGERLVTKIERLVK